MFHPIPEPIQSQMHRLEAIDERDRQDRTPHLQRLRQVPAETGRLLALLAASVPPGALIEIGTSAGYSTLWLALAGRETGRQVITFEVLEEKQKLARATFSKAEVDDQVVLVAGDARESLLQHPEIAFCFLDAEKEIYQECYDLVIPRLVPGGILVADNVDSHREALSAMIAASLEDRRVDAVIVPIGTGVLLCRKGTSEVRNTGRQE